VGSTFPIENRLWEYKPLGRMGIKHREETVYNIARFLTTLEGKTLVHCHSYGIAKMLSEALRPICKSKVFLQVNNMVDENENDNYYRKDIVYQFKHKYEWIKCDKCGIHTLTPYKDYGYTLCPTHHIEILRMVRVYMTKKEMIT